MANRTLSKQDFYPVDKKMILLSVAKGRYITVIT